MDTCERFNLYKFKIMNIGKSLEQRLDTKLFSNIRCKILTIFFDIKLNDNIVTNIREITNVKVWEKTNISYEYR